MKTSMDPDNDPYLWLEEVESEASLDWVRERNSLVEERLAGLPGFEEMKARILEEMNSDDKIAYPNIVGDYVYNLWTDADHVRGLWRRMSLSDYLAGKEDWETVIDLDILSEKEGEKWVFHGAAWLQPDCRYCLVSLSDGGTDADEIREFDSRTKTFLEDGFFIPEAKNTVAWVDENSLLVGTDFGPGSMTTSGYSRTLRLWKRGTALNDAPQVFEIDSTEMGVFVSSMMENGRRYVIAYQARSFYNSQVHFFHEGAFKPIPHPSDAEFTGFHKNQILITLQSDWELNGNTFGTGSLVSFDLDKALDGDQHVSTLFLPDAKSSILYTASTKDFVLVTSMENVITKARIYRLQDGEWMHSELELPGMGTVDIVSTSNRGSDYFFVFDDFLTPESLYHGKGEEYRLIKNRKAAFNADKLITEQYVAKSKDGTEIPYFIVRSEDMVLNGQNPVLQYGYGGFNSSERPYYSYSVGIGWLEMGGAYVIANIRGGGEFGPAWHQAAIKEKRQNAYDDFFAVSEDLIARGITSPEHLGAFGWSNGGLLAGVAFTQRPDLYNAVVVGAPLLDMYRYDKLLAGASWVGEYGDPDNPEEWAYLQKYSPYHNLDPEETYPEVFFITSTKDDRVHPGHARKMAAKMEDMGHPYLYHETIEGGHGAASTNEQRAHLIALRYAYLRSKLN